MKLTGDQTRSVFERGNNTSDTTNPTLINLIESDLAAYRLREDLDRDELAADARARMELQKLTAERQRQRVPADLLELEAESESCRRLVSINSADHTTMKCCGLAKTSFL